MNSRQNKEKSEARLRTTGYGALIMIGGHEDKTGEKIILREVAQRIGDGKLVIASVASEMAHEVWQAYDRAFDQLGVKKIEHLEIERRDEAVTLAPLEILEGATGIFFTGGDQLKITTKLGGTKIIEKIREIYENGGTVAGTSAGASVMSETMLVSGLGGESHKVGGALLMAPGLGLAEEMIVDQHFAQRGRIGRLLGAVAQNPGILGIGIDEDTAIVVEGEKFVVRGSGAVYVVDGREVSYTNVSEEEAERTMCMFDVKLHVLGHGNAFDLRTREPNKDTLA